VKFDVVYSRQGEADLLALPPKVQRQVATKIARLQQGFSGDIKKLQGADIAYRLRSGNYRVLFDLAGSTLVIRAIRDRKEAYE
jgi:mRNA-degrading endonuclease RelE of RelBE toxin-antitoxin system